MRIQEVPDGPDLFSGVTLWLTSCGLIEGRGEWVTLCFQRKTVLLGKTWGHQQPPGQNPTRKLKTVPLSLPAEPRLFYILCIHAKVIDIVPNPGISPSLGGINHILKQHKLVYWIVLCCN